MEKEEEETAEFIIEEQDEFVNKINEIFAQCLIDPIERKELRFNIELATPFQLRGNFEYFKAGMHAMPVAKFFLKRNISTVENLVVSRLDVYMVIDELGDTTYNINSVTDPHFTRKMYNTILRSIFILSAKRAVLTWHRKSKKPRIFRPDIIGSYVVSEYSAKAWKHFKVVEGALGEYAAIFNEKLYERAKVYFKKLMTEGIKGDCKETDKVIESL